MTADKNPAPHAEVPAETPPETSEDARAETGTPPEHEVGDQAAQAVGPETPASEEDAPGAKTGEEAQPARQMDAPAAPEASRPDDAAAQPPARGSAAGMIVGGVLAAAIGAATALAVLPEGWRPHDTSALERRIAALEARPQPLSADDLALALAPIEARLAALESADLVARVSALEARGVPDLTPVLERLDALESRGLDEQALARALEPLARRLDQMESDLGAQARAAVSAALADARAQIESQAQALSSREEDLQRAQAMIAARAALADLVVAAETGAPQAGALATLAEVTDVPDALAPFAEGLVTLAELQDSFSRAARAALAAAPLPQDAGVTDRLLTFLRRQTGARSLAPREGDDPDAVLSRAEAALRQGNLARALSELDALTDGPAEAMAEWRAAAQTRLDALAALEALEARLTRSED